MSRNVPKEKFYEEEDVKCSPPQRIPWSNPNEVRAIQKDEEAVAMEEGVPFQEKEKIKGSDNLENLVESEKGIDIEYPDTSGDQHMASPSRPPDVSPGTETVDTEVHHPAVARRTRIPQRTFPGAYRAGGSDNEEGDDEDELTIESYTEPPTPPTLEAEAELVDTVEEERQVQDKINQATKEALEKERQKVVVAEIVPEVITSKRDRRWKFAGAFLLVLLLVLGVVLGITLRPDTGPETYVPQDLIDLLSNASSDSGDALSTPSTPQNKALGWLASNANLANYTDQDKIQRYALATLYYSTEGDNWIRREKWLSNADVCGQWYAYDPIDNTFIKCTSTGAIFSLELIDNNLIGTIPAEIGMLSNSLETLSLDSNDLHGTLPNEIASLTKLTSLSLWNNSFIGTFPSAIVNLTNLEKLYLAYNEYTGPIPSEIGHLTKAEIAHNLGNNSLMLLDLRGNRFGGTVPTSIGTFTNLYWLGLADNYLIGTIPTELGMLSKLEELHLNSNRLTGTIPIILASLSLLKDLVLYQNDLNGTIPTELGLLSNLEKLSLNADRLTGTVPTSLASLPRLKELYLAENDFTGSVNALCGIDLEAFAVNICGEYDEINCTCCSYCCDPAPSSYCNLL